ncbi:hypothetical protein Droror1_Dr00016651 [Drosera rotundifolia]
MLAGFVNKNGYESDALEVFEGMRASGVGIDEFTVTTMFNVVAKQGLPSLGAQLHSCIIKSGNVSSGFVVSSLIDMYSKCGCFREACQVFDDGKFELDVISKNAMVAACCRKGDLDLAWSIFQIYPELNDTVSWNTLISGFEQNSYHDESLKLFSRMVDNGARLNEHTFASALSACSGLRDAKLGKEVHARVFKEDGFTPNQYISSSIVDMYCKCGNMEYAELANATSGMEKNRFSITSMILGYSSSGNMVKAQELFDSLMEKNSVVWTALFSGYVKSQQCPAVLMLFKELLGQEAPVLDPLILITVLGACAILASLDHGKQIHAFSLRMGIKMDKKLSTAIMDMYSKCGNLAYAERTFRNVMSRDTVLYNVMLSGYAHHGNIDVAVSLLQEMLGRDLKPDAATFIALLSACRHAGSVELGEKLFQSMETDYNILPEIDHYSCMIDLYGRANQLEKAMTFVKTIPVKPDGIIWGALLNACKLNGNKALAREVEKILLRIEGDDGSRYVQLANAYAAEGDWEETGRIRKKMKGKEVKKLVGCSWIYVENQVGTFTSGNASHASEAIYSMLDCLIAGIDHVSEPEPT